MVGGFSLLLLRVLSKDGKKAKFQVLQDIQEVPTVKCLGVA